MPVPAARTKRVDDMSDVPAAFLKVHLVGLAIAVTGTEVVEVVHLAATAGEHAGQVGLKRPEMPVAHSVEKPVQDDERNASGRLLGQEAVTKQATAILSGRSFEIEHPLHH